MGTTLISCSTISRSYLRNKTKDEIIELYMGTLNELDAANGLIRDLCSRDSRDEAYIRAIDHLLAYGVLKPSDNVYLSEEYRAKLKAEGF